MGDERETRRLPSALRDALDAMKSDEILCDIMSRKPWIEVFETGLMNGWAYHEKHMDTVLRLAATDTEDR